MFSLFKNKKRRVYLDHAAATPMRDEVAKEMQKAFVFFANPSSLHEDGVLAHKFLESGRVKVAGAAGARPDEITFLSSGTESDNLAIRGTVTAFLEKNKNIKPHIVTSTVEHSAVLEVVKALQREGLCDVTFISPEKDGTISIKKIKESLRPETVLVSIIHANNEIGTLVDIKEISKTIRHFKKYDKGDHLSTYPLLHTDASQSFAYCDIQMNTFPVDLMTFNSSKIYGPKGVALLYVRKGTPIRPIIFGGGQEKGLRPGTEDLVSISGFAKAVEISVKEREGESKRLKDLQEYFFAKIKEGLGDRVRINGSIENRIPNNINITIFDFESELLVFELDAKGISVSSKSACNEIAGDESSVITELYPDEDARIGGLRITLGKDTTKSDLDYLLRSIKEILEKYKNFPKQTV